MSNLPAESTAFDPPPASGAARLLCRVCAHFRADPRYIIEWCERHRQEWRTRREQCPDYVCQPVRHAG